MSKISGSVSRGKEIATNEENIILENIVKKLIKMGYEEEKARLKGATLISSSPIRTHLMKWLEKGKELEYFYEEISTTALMKNPFLSYPDALGIMAWLHKDPRVARKMLAPFNCGGIISNIYNNRE